VGRRYSRRKPTFKPADLTYFQNGADTTTVTSGPH
jgi:hypothetical protein